MKTRMVRILCSTVIIACFCLPLENARSASLWHGTTIQESSLFVDEPAPQLAVNDIVVILIEESTDSKTSADTEAEIEDEIDGKISNWFSIEGWDDLWKILKFESPDITAHPNARANLNNLPRWGMDVDNEFEGEGETLRKNSVVSTIAARVIAIQPNGNVVLEGKRHIKVNEETTILKVTGIARAEDITPDKTIRSSFILDLNFAVDGRGVLTSANKRGIVSQIMGWMR